ncbi:MAG TPA: NEL-type E3 ubiquitin ligase domain-containing protein [Candidatus Rhabdochlamydia sp.]|nr:NEL-type E3 ubiquitin ligase domain-containing protein [Candidatus Rhabdochlamydia sp.]
MTVSSINVFNQPIVLRADETSFKKILEQWIKTAPTGSNQFSAETRFLKFFDGNENELDFSHLRLTSLPNIFNDPCFSRLKKLYLAGNQLTDLPESFGCLQALETLQIDSNQLTDLPESFGCLQALKILYLGGNQLTDLPESFGRLQALQELWLCHNQLLTGIPVQMLSLPHSCVIDITGCGFSSDVLERLRENVNRPDYEGPRISFGAWEDRSQREEKSIKESLEGLYRIIGASPTEFPNLLPTSELRSWLDRLSYMADYKTGGATQKLFAEKIIAVLSQANEDPILREDLYAVIQGASETCGDRVALSILYLGLAYQLAKFDLKDMHKLADFLIKGPWTIQELSNIARDKIKELRYFDEIEVYLAYPIKLKEKLEIPIDIQHMLYFSCAGLQDEDLEWAKKVILDKRKKKKECLDFLIKHPKWLEALECNYPKEFKAIKDERDKASELMDNDGADIQKIFEEGLIELTEKVLGPDF